MLLSIMKILVDTNILIGREDHKETPENLAKALSLLSRLNQNLVVHPSSIEDIKRDQNAERMKITLSKIKTYHSLESPPDYRKDTAFLNIVGTPIKPNDIVDTDMIYAVYKNAVDFLITEDMKLRKRGLSLKLAQRIFSIDESIEYFTEHFDEKKINLTSSLKIEKPYNLDINDPIFSTLKSDYPTFSDWWKKISTEETPRDVFILNKCDGSLGALLVLKIEKESEIINVSPSIPRKKRLKICTLLVTDTGNKIGELFIKTAIEKALLNNIDEIYLTHFPRENDLLVYLIEDIGFVNVGEVVANPNEKVFLKKLKPDKKLIDYSELREFYYPSFYDGKNVSKFIVPIQPRFHERLFPEYPFGQQGLFARHEIIIEGNTIKKAYLCSSNNKTMKRGDVIIFYRSTLYQGVTCIGVVEDVYNDMNLAEEIMRLVGKRSVYTHDEIKKLAEKRTKVIMFRWHFNLKNLINYQELKKKGILNGRPQTIVEIENSKYEIIKESGGIYGGFAINQT